MFYNYKLNPKVLKDQILYFLEKCEIKPSQVLVCDLSTAFHEKIPVLGITFTIGVEFKADLEVTFLRFYDCPVS